MPASFCGILGLRPTWGRVSLKGACTLAETFDTGVACWQESLACTIDDLTSTLEHRKYTQKPRLTQAIRSTLPPVLPLPVLGRHTVKAYPVYLACSFCTPLRIV